MKIGDKLLKQLNKKYAPETMVNQKFGRYDLAFKTDDEGNPVMLFIGNLDEQGRIKGDRFSRAMVKDQAGKLIKDHWDNKGKA
ncbi:hypothetical protein [Dyadobacter sp.]|uniref:hypothetical protein n=1 Tax=Dyadobacter sp. TaxID=1914288 RepID=UPI003F70AD3E